MRKFMINMDKKTLKIVPRRENDHDLYVYFYTERDALEFLDEFKKPLDNQKMCVSRNLPGMLLKRKYIKLSIMEYKTMTVRHYDKKWKPGTIFNFHDQTYFLTCELIEIIKISDDQFEYYYKVTPPTC